MTTLATTTIEVCTDCIILLANGEGPEGHADRITAIWGVTYLHASGGPGYTDAEQFFSWHPCEGCGDPLAGDRHYATAWA